MDRAPSQPAVTNRDLVEQAVRFSQTFLRRFVRSRGGPLPYSRLRVLEILHCDGAARMRELADELGLSARNVTTLADALEADDLVRRTAHPTDRRATMLEITPAGRSVVEQSLTPQMAEIMGLFDVLSPAEKQAFLGALAKLTPAIEGHGPSRADTATS